MTKTKRLLGAALGLTIVAGIPLVHAQDHNAAKTILTQLQKPDTSKPTPSANDASLEGAAKNPEPSITDAEIRDVINRIVKHNMHALADGEYPAVTNLDQAKAAKAPEGITWSYPWGVALYVIIRSTDATGDKDADKFVVEHDKICARYYQWLAGIEKQFGDDGRTFVRGRNIKIRGLITLGNLDSCGSMGNQIVETMLRHKDEVTPADKAV